MMSKIMEWWGDRKQTSSVLRWSKIHRVPVNPRLRNNKATSRPEPRPVISASREASSVPLRRHTCASPPPCLLSRHVRWRPLSQRRSRSSLSLALPSFRSLLSLSLGLSLSLSRSLPLTHSPSLSSASSRLHNRCRRRRYDARSAFPDLPSRQSPRSSSQDRHGSSRCRLVASRSRHSTPPP